MNPFRPVLFVTLGLLPVLAAASVAQAASPTPLPHHAKRHVHAASLHVLHHHKAHRAIATMRPAPQA